MKLRNVSDLPPVRETTPAAAPAPSQAADKVSIRSSAIQSALTDARNSHSTRVREISNAVSAGTYRPDPGRIADQILSDAEITARLRAMLSPSSG